MRGAAHAFLAVGFYVGGIFGAEQAAAGRRIGPVPGTFVVNRRVVRERRSHPESLYEEAMAYAALGRWKETEEALAAFSGDCSDPAHRTAVSGAMPFLVHRRDGTGGERSKRAHPFRRAAWRRAASSGKASGRGDGLRRERRARVLRVQNDRDPFVGRVRCVRAAPVLERLTAATS